MFWILGYSLNEGHQLLQVIHMQLIQCLTNYFCEMFNSFRGKKEINKPIICALENQPLMNGCLCEFCWFCSSALYSKFMFVGPVLLPHG